MASKATGQPTVRKQRDKWVVRVDGIDTSTGKHRPRQLGTFASQRSATAAARSFRAEETTIERGTVLWLVRRYVESRNDITVRQRSSTPGLSPTSKAASVRSDSHVSTVKTLPHGSRGSPPAGGSHAGACRSVATSCELR
jgi:hypothetical protein